MRRINCLVIDDEPLACKGMSEYIAEIDSISLLAAVNSPADAIRYLPETDLMYLDINMPKISGIEFLQQVKNPPLTIITTAYQQYALQSYELDVVDYLLKPVSFPRFLKATTKAMEYFKLLQLRQPDAVTERATETNAVYDDDYFFVKSNGILEKVYLSDIIAVESLSNYITIHCTEKKLVAYLTLKQIKDHLPANAFIQVHKSFVVALSKIDKIDRDDIVIHSMTIPIGSNFREAVVEQVVNGKILKR